MALNFGHLVFLLRNCPQRYWPWNEVIAGIELLEVLLMVSQQLNVWLWGSPGCWLQGRQVLGQSSHSQVKCVPHSIFLLTLHQAGSCHRVDYWTEWALNRKCQCLWSLLLTVWSEKMGDKRREVGGRGRRRRERRKDKKKGLFCLFMWFLSVLCKLKSPKWAFMPQCAWHREVNHQKLAQNKSRNSGCSECFCPTNVVNTF